MGKKENHLLEKIWKAVQNNTKKLGKIDRHVAVINSEMGAVKEDIHEMKTGYVKVERFSPVEKIVFGAVGIVLSAVIVAILSYVIIKIK